MPQTSASPASTLRTPIDPPVARRDPTPTTLHGVTLDDDYRWMRNKDSAEVLEYLNAENAYTAEFMAPTAELQAKLYTEMLSHIKETDESVPYRLGDWFYSTRTVERSQYAIHCRRRASTQDLDSAFDPTQPEQVILDINQLAEGKPFMSVGSMAISPDGNLLAYTTDATGFRQYTLHIRDLHTGTDLPDTAERVGSLAWTADSRTLFYSTEDVTTKRQDRIFRHALGTPVAEDALVLHEEDERFNVGVGRTRDGEYLMIEAGSHTANEYRFLPAKDPNGEFRLIAPRVDDQEYYPDHRYTPETGGLFYIRTNDAGKNFRVVTAPTSSPGRENWSGLIPLDPEQPLEDFDLFQSFAVATRRKLGLPVLEVLRFNSSSSSALAAPVSIAFPEPTYSAGQHVNRVFTTDVYRYSYQSLVSPASVYEYNVARSGSEVPIGESKLIKQQEVPGGFDSALYSSERVWVEANDKTSVPVSIVYRRDSFQRDGANPLYIYGYGSYGYPLPVAFSPARLSLLDRGVVMAFAHIRGGGELGDTWHDAGKMQAKRNTFTDFIAVTEQLVGRGYGDAARVAIEGGSAGGLLMGAAVNMRPDLFRVVVSHVPFVDIMNTMLDASLPLTVAEYEEWGNPNEPEAFRTMLSYSPYDNLEKLAGAPVPAMLVKTSLNDSQVMYWEPAKYVAKLRTLKTNDTPLLLHINLDAGHGGASGRYDYLKEIAFDYAFLLTQLGVVDILTESQQPAAAPAAGRPNPVVDWMSCRLRSLHGGSPWEFAVFLVMTSVLLFYGLVPIFGGDQVGLVGADEPRYAQIAREMLEAHSQVCHQVEARVVPHSLRPKDLENSFHCLDAGTVTPILYGHPWLEKPALYYWRAMSFFKEFGVSDWSARLPSATGAFLMIFMIFLHMRRFRPGGQLDAALITASCVAVIGFARGASTDMQLAAPFCIGMLGWYAWYETGKKFWLFDLYFFGAAATLAKGPVAPFLALGIILLFLGLRREWSALRRTIWIPGVLLYFVMVLPWYIAVQRENPTFVHSFFVEHNIERFATNLYQHRQPIWYYFAVLVIGLMPWTVIAIRAVVEAMHASLAEWRVRVNPRRYLGHSRAGDAFPEFLVIWAIFPIVFFTFSKSKLPGYILPSIPPVTILTGDYLNRIRRVGLPTWLLWSHGAACALVAFVIVLSPQHMVYETLVPPMGWLLCASAAALLVLFSVVQTIRIGGIAHVRNATLFPVLAAMVFLLGFHGKDLDLNYSARPLAREMQKEAPDARVVAVQDVRRDMVYGLAFYRNEEPIDYCEPSGRPRPAEENCSDGVDIPVEEHLLVIPASESAQLEKWLAGRVYEPLFLYDSQGLEVYRVYPRQ